MTRTFRLTDSEVKELEEAVSRFEDRHVLACVRGFFALGLHLRISGKRGEGGKACSSAIQAFQLPTALSEKILSNLDGNEIMLARLFRAHRAFRSLLELSPLA